MIELNHYLEYQGVIELTPDRLQKLLQQLRPVQTLRGQEVLDVFARAQHAWRSNTQWRERAQRCISDFAQITPTYNQTTDQAMLDMLDDVFSPKLWQRKLSLELPLPRALEKWYEGNLSAAILAYRPLGLLLHICPGNSFIGGLDSLLHGILTGNINIVKISRQTPAVIQVVIDLLQSVGLPRGQATLTVWSGGDSAVEIPLCHAVDGIAVWGGHDTLAHYKKITPVGVRLLEYGPKLSLSIVTQAGFTAPQASGFLQGLIRDVALYEQASCTSSQVLLIQTQHPLDSDAAPIERAQILARIRTEFEAYQREHPAALKTSHQQMEMLKALERAKLNKSLGQGDYVSGYPDWLAIWVQDGQALQPSPLFRTWLIYPWHHQDDVSQALLGVRHYLQTVGLAAAPSELMDWTDWLWSKGVQRVVQPGQAGLQTEGVPHDGGSILASMSRFVSLESPTRYHSLWQGKSPQSQLEIIAKLCQHAQQAPFYQERFVAAGLDPNHMTWAQFHQLPLLQKNDFYHDGPPNSNRLLTTPYTELQNAFIFTTGGSTGQPKYAAYSKEDAEEAGDIFCRSLQELGLNEHDRVANLFSGGGLWSAFIAVNQALEKIGCLNLSVGSNMDPVDSLQLLAQMSATAVYGLPSTLLRLAHAAEQHPEIPIQLRMIVYGGEHMNVAMREYVSQMLGASMVKSALYAAVDAGCVGYQCLHTSGGVHHVLESYAHVEICDESGLPVPDGVIGELIVTNLSRRLMPVIRIRTGDLGRKINTPCTCGAHGMLFELLGRQDDMVRVGGANVHISDVDRLCQNLSDLLSLVFQIQIDRVGVDDRMRVYIETRQILTEPERMALTEQVKSTYLELAEEVRHYLNDGLLRYFELHLLNPDSIEGNKRTGKIRRVIDTRDL